MSAKGIILVMAALTGLVTMAACGSSTAPTTKNQSTASPIPRSVRASCDALAAAHEVSAAAANGTKTRQELVADFADLEGKFDLAASYAQEEKNSALEASLNAESLAWGRAKVAESEADDGALAAALQQGLDALPSLPKC